MREAELDALTLAGAARRIRRGELSPVDLVRAVLDRIAALDGRMHAFITVTAEQALEDAAAAEEALAAGREVGPLHGVPISLKDLIDTRGIPTTAGSRILSGRIPETDATVVEKLRAAGAVLVGKTNMHEFAYGVTSVNPHYGPVRNPWDPERVAGGSSGGSAVSVALSMALGSLGTDTGGSIRIPAALSGVVGLKPTYGRVSGAGVLPLARSFDHFGPMTRTVEDAALLLEVIAGPDPKDDRTRAAPPLDLSGALGGDIRGVRIGVPRDAFDRTEPDIERLVRAALGRLERLGASLVEVELPDAARCQSVFNAVAGFEVFAWHRPLLDGAPDGYGPETRARIEKGRSVTRGDYARGLEERSRLQAELEACFRQVDLLALPAVPVAAPRIDATEVEVGGSVESVLSALTRNCRLFSTTGVPAISVPCGLTSEGLPAGLEIAGRPFDEAAVLRAARAWEQDAGWDPGRPPTLFGTTGGRGAETLSESGL